MALSSDKSRERDERWKQLMMKAQGGDSSAYDQLLRELEKVIRSYVAVRLKDKTSLDDIVQDVLMGVHHARHTYDSSKLFGPWLFAICRYKFIDYLRKYSRVQQKEVIEPEIIDLIAAPDHRDEEKEYLLEELRRAIHQLPGKQRRVVQLLKLEGKSIKEAAVEMSMSESAIKVTAHRGYKVLKTKLLGEGN